MSRFMEWCDSLTPEQIDALSLMVVPALAVVFGIGCVVKSIGDWRYNRAMRKKYPGWRNL